LIIKKVFILLVFFTSFLTGIAQEKEKLPSLHAFKVDFKLPTAISNDVFKAFMSGLVDVDFAYQYHFKKAKIVANLGVKYTYWDVERSLTGGQLIGGQLETYIPFIGIGYRNEFSEKFFMDFELKGGYGQIVSLGESCSSPYVQMARLIEPKISGYIRSSDLMYFSINVNYSHMNAEFTKDNICVTNFPGFTADASKGFYQYFSIGFGFHVYLPKIKQ